MSKKLAALLACVLIVMIGVGITLPVMPFFVERLALESGSHPERVAFHVGLLTAVFPLTQLVFAPIWGRLSDRIGRRPLVVVGIAGFALSQALFGIATGLGLLYGARIMGGALSSALLPAASAYVADATSRAERGRGIAWLNIAIGLGTIIGPAAGGLLVRQDVHVRIEGRHLFVDSFSVPFFAAAALAAVGLVVALVMIPATQAVDQSSLEPSDDQQDPPSMRILLGAAVAGYVGITMFETTFALFAMQRWGYGAGEVGTVFMVCGGVMVLAQTTGAALAARIGELRHVALGFGLMGAGLGVLMVANPGPLVFAAVTLLGAGMSFIGTSLASLISQRGSQRVGTALGLQQSAVGVGQVTGSLVGTLLFGWRARAPYVIAAVLMVAVALALALQRSRHAGRT